METNLFNCLLNLISERSLRHSRGHRRQHVATVAISSRFNNLLLFLHFLRWMSCIRVSTMEIHNRYMCLDRCVYVWGIGDNFRETHRADAMRGPAFWSRGVLQEHQ